MVDSVDFDTEEFKKLLKELDSDDQPRYILVKKGSPWYEFFKEAIEWKEGNE